MSEELDYSLNSTEVWPRYTSLWRGRRLSGTLSLGRGGYKTAPNAMREQARSRTGNRVAPARQIGTRECPRSYRRTSKNTWMILLPFAGEGQRRRSFRVLAILSVSWSTGDLPEVCRFLLITQLMFLKRGKDPTTTIFDDDEWIRSLREAQEITGDIPEERVTFDQEE